MQADLEPDEKGAEVPIGYPRRTVRTLPDQPDLERLKNEARTLQRKVRSGDDEALELIRSFHPAPAAGPDFALNEAQLALARSYGFASWPRLREHVKIINDLTRVPTPAASNGEGPGETDGDDHLADRLLRLGCLNYTDDRPSAIDEASRLLQQRPELATADVYTMAATGTADDLERLLGERPELVRTDGGPFGWVPLLYLCYSRIPDGDGRSAVAAAEVLLRAGADPNAGYLWRGLRSPFTALTGVFGGGEQDQPPHPHAVELARLLLRAGADPNDNQVLYNRMFSSDDDHLRLLFDHGLGTEVDSPWRRLIGEHYPTPEQMITEQLRWAADHHLPDRIRLLLEHGVDVDGRGYHPNFGDQTPYQLAVLAGDREIAELLAAAGADTTVVDPVDALIGACLAEDRAEVQRLSATDPTLVEQAVARRPGAIAAAAEKGRLEGVRILLELGFDPNDGGVHGRTGLHVAAHDGRADIVDLLLEHGADPNRIEQSFAARPSGWAEHGGHPELAARLKEAEG